MGIVDVAGSSGVWIGPPLGPSTPTSPSRISVILVDVRTVRITSDPRILAVAPEARSTAIPAEGRVRRVPVESRSWRIT